MSMNQEFKRELGALGRRRKQLAAELKTIHSKSDLHLKSLIREAAALRKRINAGVRARARELALAHKTFVRGTAEIDRRVAILEGRMA